MQQYSAYYSQTQLSRELHNTWLSRDKVESHVLHITHVVTKDHIAIRTFIVSLKGGGHGNFFSEFIV